MNIQLSAGIALLSGVMFDYNNPRATEVPIEDLAHALSNVCRFSGHLHQFYSVAQHSVNASYIVERGYEYDALLHDTAEAFTNDLPTPLKTALPVFKDLEISIESAMAEQFGFSYPLPAPVKLADLQMLKLEKEYLKRDQNQWAILDGVDTSEVLSKVDLSLWAPERAKAEFLRRYEELCS